MTLMTKQEEAIGNSSTGVVAAPQEEASPKQLPVVIAGAGPCGLVAALTLQQEGIPFVMYERASRDKLCSNAGSGIDMAPTAITIIEEELGIDLLGTAMRAYEYLYMADIETGQTVKTMRLKDLKLPKDRIFGFANRADLQRALLAKMSNEEQVLHCGITVQSFAQTNEHVEVSLSNGTTVRGSALLACDGIHSAVRAHMNKNVKDELNYIGQECWWGKTTIVPGSDLDKALRQVEVQEGMELSDNGTGGVGIAYLSTRQHAGCFFSCPVDHETHAWVYIRKQPTSPKANQSNDLTRRGGTILTQEQKRQELMDHLTDSASVLRLMLEETPSEDITRAAFFDRSNLTLPYVQGRVALLGDAAHPQSPALGQGANMAIVDGYVLAKHLSASKLQNVPSILKEYDSRARRKGNNKIIKTAREYSQYMVSDNRFTCWFLKTVIRRMPPSMMVKDLIRSDRPNQHFVKALEKSIEEKA